MFFINLETVNILFRVSTSLPPRRAGTLPISLRIIPTFPRSSGVTVARLSQMSLPTPLHFLSAGRRERRTMGSAGWAEVGLTALGW